MNNEDKIIIAFVFNRAGKKEMSFSELFLTLSIDLKWFRPDEAKTFITKSIETSLLKHEKNIIKPNFNIEAIKVPTGFYPSKKAYQNNKKTKECSIEGIVSCYQTGEYFPGIHIFLAKQVQTKDAGKLVIIEKVTVTKRFDGKFNITGKLEQKSYLYFTILGYNTSEFDINSIVN